MSRRDRLGVAPDFRRSLASRSGAVLVLAICSLASPAAAEPVGTSLSVGATVMPSCLVSTEDQARSGSGAAVSCSNFGEGSIAIERDPTPSSGSPEPDRTGQATESSAREDIRYITISY